MTMETACRDRTDMLMKVVCRAQRALARLEETHRNRELVRQERALVAHRRRVQREEAELRRERAIVGYYTGPRSP